MGRCSWGERQNGKFPKVYEAQCMVQAMDSVSGNVTYEGQGDNNSIMWLQKAWPQEPIIILNKNKCPIYMHSLPWDWCWKGLKYLLVTHSYPHQDEWEQMYFCLTLLLRCHYATTFSKDRVILIELATEHTETNHSEQGNFSTTTRKVCPWFILCWASV